MESTVSGALEDRHAVSLDPPSVAEQDRHSGPGRSARASLYDLTLDELARHVADLPSYRVEQIHRGLYRQLCGIEEITALPTGLRRQLSDNEALQPALTELESRSADRGETVKWLFACPDGSLIETVLMHHPRHSTVCVSSQAGCAMRCQFCATGDAGFARQLSTGEIVEQVVRAARQAKNTGRRLDHVVFMGMGEPLANFPRVWRATERIIAEMGIAARHVTISTVGVVPAIRAFAAKPQQVNLAVSLHAANDELRDKLVPINRRYPIADLITVLEEYVSSTHRRISFEWALMEKVNDSGHDAAELAVIARRLRAHVNLIPLNPTVGGSERGLRGSPPARVRAFREQLLARGVNVTVRQTRGREIEAACGQLAGSVPSPSATADSTGHEPPGPGLVGRGRTAARHTAGKSSARGVVAEGQRPPVTRGGIDLPGDRDGWRGADRDPASRRDGPKPDSAAGRGSVL